MRNPNKIFLAMLRASNFSVPILINFFPFIIFKTARFQDLFFLKKDA